MLKLPGKTCFVLALAVIPFWTSYIVRSYAWSLVLAKKGVLNGWLADTDGAQGMPPDSTR